MGDATGSWLVAVVAGFLVSALAGLLLQVAVFRHMPGQDLRQTMFTIGLSIVIADRHTHRHGNPDANRNAWHTPGDPDAHTNPVSVHAARQWRMAGRLHQ